jgi:hypothetical protein
MRKPEASVGEVGVTGVVGADSPFKAKKDELLGTLYPALKLGCRWIPPLS